MNKTYNITLYLNNNLFGDEEGQFFTDIKDLNNCILEIIEPSELSLAQEIYFYPREWHRRDGYHMTYYYCYKSLEQILDDILLPKYGGFVFLDNKEVIWCK